MELWWWLLQTQVMHNGPFVFFHMKSTHIVSASNYYLSQSLKFSCFEMEINLSDISFYSIDTANLQVYGGFYNYAAKTKSCWAVILIVSISVFKTCL